MRRNAASVIKIVALALLIAVIVFYSLFQAWKLIRGPVITVTNPQNGSTYNQALIQIEGVAKNISYLNLNDRPIFTDKNGHFSEKFLLSPGYNIIKLDAKDKFKNYTEKTLKIILKEY